MPTITLRPQKFDDAQRFYEILNNPNFTYLSTRPKSLAAEKKWLKANLKNKKKDRLNCNYTILYGREVAGGIGLKINCHRRYVGEIGYFIDEKYWGRGIASRAVKLMENIGFKKLKLARIEIVMQPANRASEKVARKNGYKKEGLMKKAVKDREGKVKDCFIYAKVLK